MSRSHRFPASLCLFLLIITTGLSAQSASTQTAAIAPAEAVTGKPVETAIAASDTEAATLVPVTDWLLLGPVTVHWPAFHEAAEKGYGSEDLLESGSLDPRCLRVEAGLKVALPGVPESAWQPVAAPEGTLDLAGKEYAAEAYLATYVQADRWQAVTLHLASAQPLRVFLDGKDIPLSADDIGPAQPPDSTTMKAQQGTLKLAMGKHLLVIHTVREPDQKTPWQLVVRLQPGKEIPAEALRLTADPQRAVQVDDILDAPLIADAVVSPDGKLVAVTLRAYDCHGEQERWLEIRSCADGSLQRSWRGEVDFDQVRWLDSAERLSYTTSKKDKGTIWLYDLRDGSTTALVRDVENLGAYQWAPDGSFLVYAFTVKAKPDEHKVKRILNPEDRQPDWRDRSYLVQQAVPGGASRRLTAGPLSAESWSIAPDGQHLLFFRTEPDLTERPYSRSELWQLDLATLAADKILEDHWISGASYGPDPGCILLSGSPSAFDGLGSALPAGVTPNDYGGQLYLYDLATREAKAISREFDPAIESVSWSLADGRIYALCVDRQLQSLYAYDPQNARWSKLDAGIEVVDSFDLARQARTAVAYGTSVTSPVSLRAVDLKKGSSRLLLQPDRERYQDITFGKVEPRTCTLPDGRVLDGRLYYPRDFDPQRKYPCLVYYYGGTFPIGRDFGGRYPKNVWAGHGYFIYVPEPSGALGYGQQFSARHVNDWGKITAGEVISGTRALLASCAYIDPARVGCIGASYGGFLTEYLLTQTDMFAAAVSHAGISDITSYWGEGYWGYTYGARALAGRFPWSDKELFVGQSPLFQADKITTPLLLLHGSADTNVPEGESIQLFTALKLLGRDVEFVQIEGQNHWILNHEQRIIWNDTILAYFAKYLKGQPQWWEDLYGDVKNKAPDAN